MRRRAVARKNRAGSALVASLRLSVPLLMELRLLLLEVPLEDDPDCLVLCFRSLGFSMLCALISVGAVGTSGAGGSSAVSEELAKPLELIGCVDSSWIVDAIFRCCRL